MNLTIFTGPDPSANLAELFKRTPLRRSPVCVIVPDNRSVTTMQKRLARLYGNAFLGHRVYTFERLVMKILSQNGTPPQMIPEHVKRALLAEIIRSRISERSKFAAISVYPGFVSQLVSFLEDVRSRTDGRLSMEHELVSIASAYESHLARFGMNDHEGTLVCALEGDNIQRFARAFRGSLIVDGFYDLTDRQFEFLKRLFPCFTNCAVTLVNDPLRPSLFKIPARLLSRYRSINAKIVQVKMDSFSDPDRALSGFMREGEVRTQPVHPGGDSENLQIHTFRSETAEADWIAGTILTMLCNGVWRPEDIMIVTRYTRGFGSVMEKALKAHGIQVNGGFARPLISQPVVRLVLDALEASIHPEKEELISSVQRSNYIGDPVAGEQLSLEGIDDRGWSCMIADIDSPEGYTVSLTKMLEWLMVQGNLDGGGIREYAFSESAAFERLIELLDEFAHVYSSFRKMMRADEFSHLLRLFIGNVTIPDRPFPGEGVLVVDVNHARYVRRDVVFVTGLDEASFPAPDIKYSLHDDDIARELREHHQAEQPLLFYMAAYGAQQLFLTFPGIDDEGSDNAMSPYLREIQDAVSSWCKSRFHPRIAGAAWEEGASRRRGQYEQLVRELKKDYAGAPSILSSVGMNDLLMGKRIKKALKALIHRVENRGVYLSEHPSFSAVYGQWNSNRIFSVTDLERYVLCPVNFFLSRVIGLAVEIRVPGELDPATRGLIVHEILKTFYTERKKRGGKTGFTPDELSECKNLMREIVETIFPGMIRRIEGVHPVTVIAEKKFIHSWMELFLEQEANYFENTHFEPFAFEIEFGREGNGDKEKYPALTLEHENASVLIGGRIDRVDMESREGNQYIRIIDYKTGNVETKLKDLSEGYALQIPLYLDAARHVLFPGSIIHDGVYYSLRDMELKTYKEKRQPLTGKDWEDYIDSACSKAVSAVSDILKGNFPLPDTKCDEYCEFISLCRGGHEGRRIKDEG